MWGAVLLLPSEIDVCLTRRTIHADIIRHVGAWERFRLAVVAILYEVQILAVLPDFYKLEA